MKNTISQTILLLGIQLRYFSGFSSLIKLKHQELGIASSSPPDNRGGRIMNIEASLCYSSYLHLIFFFGSTCLLTGMRYGYITVVFIFFFGVSGFRRLTAPSGLRFEAS